MSTVNEQSAHVQLCKKVSQLTKVIYHLNTKLDEHNTELESLKSRHEEEITQVYFFNVSQHVQLLFFLAHSIKVVQDCFVKVSDFRHRIVDLETKLRENEPLKRAYKEVQPEHRKKKSVSRFFKLKSQKKNNN